MSYLLPSLIQLTNRIYIPERILATSCTVCTAPPVEAAYVIRSIYSDSRKFFPNEDTLLGRPAVPPTSEFVTNIEICSIA